MNKTPLSPAFNRLDEAHRAWHLAAAGYHSIEDFRAPVNSMIQSLRNVTFVLQAHKKDLDNFDEWYEPWREKMIKDPVMKIVCDARVDVVHKSDLELHSKGQATLRDWEDQIHWEAAFDPFLNSSNVSDVLLKDLLRRKIFNDDELGRMIFDFKRTWIYEKIPDTELLSALAHSYIFLERMLFDAIDFFSIDPELESTLREASFCKKDRNSKNEFTCMHDLERFSTLVISPTLEGVLERDVNEISVDEKMREKSEKRYGDLWKSKEIEGLLQDMLPEGSFFDFVRSVSQVALANFKVDKYLLPTFFLFKKNDLLPIINSTPFKSQQEKLFVLKNIALDIKREEIDAVVFVGEVWITSFENPEDVFKTKTRKNSREEIQICVLCRELNGFLEIPVERTIFGKIKYGTPKFTKDNGNQNIIKPLKNALEESRSLMDNRS